MNYRSEYIRRSATAACIATLLVLCTETGAAQGAQLRVGVQSGMQSSVLRYTVQPFSGTYQSTIDEGSVHGLSIGYDASSEWSLMLEIEWKSFGWSIKRGDDPLITLEMAERSTMQIPLLLRYKPSILPIPLYLAAGAMLAIPNNGRDRHLLSYRGFSEREGWTSYEFRFDQIGTSLHALAESGLDLELSSSLSLLLAARYQLGTEDIVDSQRLRMQTLSVWRLRAALYIAL
jgi:hypothetical protein